MPYVNSDKVRGWEEQHIVKHPDGFFDVKSMCKQVELFWTSWCLMRGGIKFFRTVREMAPLPIAQISSALLSLERFLIFLAEHKL